MLVIALLMPGAVAAQAPTPTPTLVWEQSLDIGAPPPDYRPLDPIRALAARHDGGLLLVVQGADTAARLLAFDADGRALYSRPLPAPDGMKRPWLGSVAVNGEATDRVWLFLNWTSGDEAPDQSQLVSIDAGGAASITARLPRGVVAGKDATDSRGATVLRRLRDGSLVAGGTVGFGPPAWWYARFTTGGRLLHEAKSRRFPDQVEDAWGNADGGYTLLMVDAEGGREYVTIRRFGPDGKQVSRRELPALHQSYPCAVLVGEMRHMRPQREEVRTPGQASAAERHVLVVHEVGRGIIRRIELDAPCGEMKRVGGSIVIVLGKRTADGRETNRLLSMNTAGDVRWSLDVDTPDVRVAPMPDGGVVVVRIEAGTVARLARYRAP